MNIIKKKWRQMRSAWQFPTSHFEGTCCRTCVCCRNWSGRCTRWSARWTFLGSSSAAGGPDSIHTDWERKQAALRFNIMVDFSRQSKGLVQALCFCVCDLPGNGRNRVDQRRHEAEEEGALPFHKFLLEIQQEQLEINIKNKPFSGCELITLYWY